ncbi:myb-like protein Q [Ptychodera flava]|uniref:myb-like protein Q n=1 Tax=Ptychodera flava TaxID=63121 RepID=UPI003969D6EC
MLILNNIIPSQLMNGTFPYGVPNERRNIQQEDPMERMGLINNPWVVSSSIQHEQQRTGYNGSTRSTVCTNAPCAIPYYQEVPGYQQRTGYTCLHRPQQMSQHQHVQQQLCPSFGQPQHVHQPLSQPQINQQQHTEPNRLQRPGPLQQQSQVLLTLQSQVQQHQQYQGNDITNVEGAGVNSEGNEAASAAPAEYCVNDDMTSSLVENEA